MPDRAKSNPEQPDREALERDARARLAAAAVILRRLRVPLQQVCADLDAMVEEFQTPEPSERLELMGEGSIPSSFWWNAVLAANLESEGSPVERLDGMIAKLEHAATVTDSELAAEFEAHQLAKWRKRFPDGGKGEVARV